MSLFNLSSAQLRQAADLKEKIEALQSQLSQFQGADEVVADPAEAPRKKISAAGIERIRAAQKVRWAKTKVGTPDTAPVAVPAKRGRRKMSAAGRARIAAAARARWARVRAAKAGK